MKISQLALSKHQTKAIKNPPPIFQTVSLQGLVNKGERKGRGLYVPAPVEGRLKGKPVSFS